MLTSQSIIKSDNNPANNAVDFTGKLAFAAKFGSGATAGHYMANVVLSLAIEPKEVTGLSSISTMQEMTPEICAASAVGDTAILRDTRDNATYTVAKIKNRTDDDALCWMTQNLKLIDKTLTPADSDITNNFTIPTSSTTGFSSNNENQTSKAYYDNNYGAYYNWYTATAGTGNNSLITDGANAINSICPKGWRLPTSGGTSGDFYRLANGLTGSILTSTPYNFIYSEHPVSGKIPDNHTDGYYWSSTAYTTNFAYCFNLSNSSVTPSKIGSRYAGYSIRCVAK